MSNDWYSDFVNSGFGKSIAGTVGLPPVPQLRRYEPGQPLLSGPALLGTATADGNGTGTAVEVVANEVSTAWNPAGNGSVMNTRSTGWSLTSCNSTSNTRAASTVSAVTGSTKPIVASTGRVFAARTRRVMRKPLSRPGAAPGMR